MYFRCILSRMSHTQPYGMLVNRHGILEKFHFTNTLTGTFK